MVRRFTGIRNPPRTQAAIIRIAALAVLLLVGSYVGYRLGWFNYRHTVQHLDRIRRSHSVWVFGLVFTIVYALGTSVGFPGLPFTVAAGALFGTLLGSALSWAGAMLGAMVGYTVARTIGHDVVARWLTRYERANTAVTQANTNMEMVLQALSNFHYNVLQVGAQYAENGTLQLQARLEGKNPDQEKSPPIHFNLTVQENIPALLKSLRLVNDLEDSVRNRFSRPSM